MKVGLIVGLTGACRKQELLIRIFLFLFAKYYNQSTSPVPNFRTKRVKHDQFFIQYKMSAGKKKFARITKNYCVVVKTEKSKNVH